jgi:hypothetical protein
LVPPHAVVGHQEPAATALLNLMKRHARRRLHDQAEEAVRIPPDRLVKCTTAFHLREQLVLVSSETSGAKPFESEAGRCRQQAQKA